MTTLSSHMLESLVLLHALECREALKHRRMAIVQTFSTLETVRFQREIGIDLSIGA